MLGDVILIIVFFVIGIMIILWGAYSVIYPILNSKKFEFFEENQRLKKENRKLQKKCKEFLKKSENNNSTKE